MEIKCIEQGKHAACDNKRKFFIRKEEYFYFDKIKISYGIKYNVQYLNFLWLIE